MKKKVILSFSILFIVVLYIFVLSKYAFNFNRLKASISTTTNCIAIECQKNRINVGESTNCVLRGNSINQMQLFEGKLSSNSNLNITNVEKSSIWTIGENSKNMQFISNGTQGVFDIVSFKI